jgi:hypothetical protein
MLIKHTLQLNLMSMAHCGNYLVWKNCGCAFSGEILCALFMILFPIYEKIGDWKIRVTLCNGNHSDITDRPAYTVTVFMAT